MKSKVFSWIARGFAVALLARTAAEKGTRDAFLAFLAADSLAFKPDLVGGKDFWRSRPASPGLLLALEVLSPRPQKPKA